MVVEEDNMCNSPHRVLQVMSHKSHMKIIGEINKQDQETFRIIQPKVTEAMPVEVQC